MSLDRRFSPLVEADGLRYRILSHRVHGESSSQGDEPEPRNTAIGQAFQVAFNSVWSVIPEGDRQLLLRYWLEHRDGKTDTQTHRPQFLLVDLGSLSSLAPPCADNGHRLNFPVTLIAEGLLTLAIARALATVHLYASRLHWQMVLDLIETPFAKWEKSAQGRKATEVSRDEKLKILELAFLRRTATELDRILARWHIPEPSRNAP